MKHFRLCAAAIIFLAPLNGVRWSAAIDLPKATHAPGAGVSAQHLPGINGIKTSGLATDAGAVSKLRPTLLWNGRQFVPQQLAAPAAQLDLNLTPLEAAPAADVAAEIAPAAAPARTTLENLTAAVQRQSEFPPAAADPQGLDASLRSLIDGQSSHIADPEERRTAAIARMQSIFSQGQRLPEAVMRLERTWARAKDEGRALVVVDAGYATMDKFASLDWVPNEVPVRTAMSHALAALFGSLTQGLETDVLVLSPAVIPDEVVETVISGLPASKRETFRSHFHRISFPGLPFGEYPAHVSHRILTSPNSTEIIQGIREVIANRFGDVPAIYRAYNVTDKVARLAELLGIPTFSAPAERIVLGTKSGFFEFLIHIAPELKSLKLGDGEVRLTRSVRHIYSKTQLVDALYSLLGRSYFSADATWVKKDASSGLGNALYDYTGLAEELHAAFDEVVLRHFPELAETPITLAAMFNYFQRSINLQNVRSEVRPEYELAAKGVFTAEAAVAMVRFVTDLETAIKKVIASQLPHMEFADTSLTWDRFIQDIRTKGGTAELQVPDADKKVSSPSAGIMILPDGTVDRASIHIQEQWLMGKGVFRGSRSPIAPDISASITIILLKVAENLSKLGVRGYFGLDFMVVPRPQGGNYYWIIENNQREIGSTSASVFARVLTESMPDENGVLKLSNGDVVAHMIEVENGVQYYDLMGSKGAQHALLDYLQGPAGKGVFFDADTKEGVLPYMPELIESIGSVYAFTTAHAPTAKEAITRRDALEAQLVRRVNQFRAERRTGTHFQEGDYDSAEGALADGRRYKMIGTKGDPRPDLVAYVDRMYREGDSQAQAIVRESERRDINVAALLQAHYDQYLTRNGLAPEEVVSNPQGGGTLVESASHDLGSVERKLARLNRTLAANPATALNELFRDLPR